MLSDGPGGLLRDRHLLLGETQVEPPFERIRIDFHQTGPGGDALERVQVRLLVHAKKLGSRRFRRVEAGDELIETRGEQPILDRAEPLRPLRMSFAHLVQQAIRMRDEGEGHGPRRA